MFNGQWWGEGPQFSHFCLMAPSRAQFIIYELMENLFRNTLWLRITSEVSFSWYVRGLF